MSQPCSAWFNGQKTALLHNQHLQGGKKGTVKKDSEKDKETIMCIYLLFATL